MSGAARAAAAKNTRSKKIIIVVFMVAPLLFFLLINISKFCKHIKNTYVIYKSDFKNYSSKEFSRNITVPLFHE